MKTIKQIICILLLTFIIPSANASSIQLTKDHMPVVVSLGDSYSAGEGVQPYYGQFSSDKHTCEDWIAHRSTLSWPSLLQYNGVSLSSVKATNPVVANGLHLEQGADTGSWYFAAVSGAETKDIISLSYWNEDLQKTLPSEGQRKEIQKVAFHTTKIYDLNLQIEMVKAVQKKQQIDYITMTIGGNDVDFVDIVKTAAMGSSWIDMSNLQNKVMSVLADFWDKDSYADRFEKTYLELLDAAPTATVVIAGYPQLFHINEDKSGVGGLFNYEECTFLNSAVLILNKYIKKIITDLDTQPVFFVDVQESFEGHGAYSEYPYINGVVMGNAENINFKSSNSVLSSASFHPNAAGVYAYASAVQEELAKIDSGFADIDYGINPYLEVYGYDGSLYDNYTVEIVGEKNKNIIGGFDLWGLLKEEYTDTIAVTEAKTLPLNLPKGEYLLTITDGLDSTKQVYKSVKIRNKENNKIIEYQTNFGILPYENNSSIQGAFDPQVIPSDAVEFNGHWYKAFNDSMTWEAARDYCVSQKGYLSTITSLEEQAFISHLVQSQEKRSYWIGLTDEEESGNWKWVNDEPFSYSNWGQNEPNNGFDGKEHYVAIVSYDTKYDFPIFWGEWNDHANDRDLEQFGFICEWGEYTVAAGSASVQEPIRTTSDERDIVLVLDVSGSMSGTPMTETKKASANFIDTVLDEDASIGIVTYDNSASMLSDFSVNKTALTEAVSSIWDGGGTNIEAGLAEARAMLNTSEAKKKIIVLMSDGEPNDGKEGDALISYADEIKNDGIILYTLGFFESLGSYKASAQQLMEGIASDGCHYEVASADDLVFFFEDMADQINGQKYIYIRIACPVDVSVTYNGETLNSAEDDLTTRTDFGTLTFEENENAGADVDDRVKVLRLKEGTNYDVQIVGTGRGIMDYTIGFMDENGEYSDLREFENIKITKQTVIDTVAKISRETVLNVDEDGDGKYDLHYRAEENGYGEEYDQSAALYTYVGIAGSVLLVYFILWQISNFKKRKKQKHNAGR